MLVEIGAGRGALVLYAPADQLGTELEIGSLRGPHVHVHTAVRERNLPGGSVCAALFGSLPVGRYRVRGTGQVVSVEDGAVAEVHLGA